MALRLCFSTTAENDQQPPFQEFPMQLMARSGVELGCERVFLIEPPKTLMRQLLRGDCRC